MTDEEKTLQRQTRQALGFSAESIVALEHEDELVALPNDDPGKIKAVFAKALG